MCERKHVSTLILFSPPYTRTTVPNTATQMCHHFNFLLPNATYSLNLVISTLEQNSRFVAMQLDHQRRRSDTINHLWLDRRSIIYQWADYEEEEVSPCTHVCLPVCIAVTEFDLRWYKTAKIIIGYLLLFALQSKYFSTHLHDWCLKSPFRLFSSVTLYTLILNHSFISWYMWL